MTDNITQLVPGKSDRELTTEVKAEMLMAIQPFLDLCTDVKKSGFDVQITIGSNAFGVVGVHTLNLIKVF